MEVKFEIQNEKIDELMHEQVGALTSEQLSEVVLQAFRQYLSNEKNLIDIITNCETDDYGYPKREYSQIVCDAVSKVDLTPLFDEVREQMVQTLKEHFGEMVQNVFKQAFVAGISREVVFSDTFNRAIQEALWRANNKH